MAWLWGCVCSTTRTCAAGVFRAYSRRDVSGGAELVVVRHRMLMLRGLSTRKKTAQVLTRALRIVTTPNCHIAIWRCSLVFCSAYATRKRSKGERSVYHVYECTIRFSALALGAIGLRGNLTNKRITPAYPGSYKHFWQEGRSSAIVSYAIPAQIALSRGGCKFFFHQVKKGLDKGRGIYIWSMVWWEKRVFFRKCIYTCRNAQGKHKFVRFRGSPMGSK